MEWYVFAIISALLSGLIPLAGKKALKKMSVIDFSVLHSLGAFVMTLALLPFIKFSFEPWITFLIFLAAGFSALGFYFVNKALKKYDVSLVSPMRSLNPVVLLVLAVVFLGEQLTAYNMFGILLIALGTYVIEAAHPLERPVKTLKHMVKTSVFLLVLISAIFYAVSSILDKMVLASYDLFSFILIIHFFLALDFLIINLAEHRHVFSWNKNIKSVVPVLVVGVLLAFGSRVLMLQAITMTFVSLVIAVKHIDSLFSTVLGGTMFKEQHLRKKLVAAFIMFIGVLLVVLKLG